MTFRYSRSLCLIMALGAIFFIGLPIVLPYVATGPKGSVGDQIVLTLFGVAEAIAAIYYGAYVIEVHPSHIAYGIFSKSTIYFDDLKNVIRRDGMRVSTIDLITKNGRNVSFTSSISDFNRLCDELGRRLKPFHIDPMTL